MKLKYRSRLEQKTQAFSLEKTTRKDIDCILDGVDIPRPMYSKNWVQESNVHQAVKLTDSVLTTRNFVGAQANIVRDELRKLTYALHIEGDENYLILSKIKDSKIVKQSTIDKNVWRSHLALDKYTGKCSALYIKTVEQDNRLYLDGKEIQTQDSDIDFPYLSFSQLPIGHVPNKPANFILLSYKSRATGNIYYREVSSVGIGSEKLLTQKPCIGGGPFAAIGNKVIFHINLVHNTTYQPAIIESNDGGESLSDTVPIDLSDLDDEIEFNPEMAAPFVDYSGIIHIPISAQVGKTIKLIDVIPQDSTATEMIEMSMYSGVGRVAAVPFPKKICSTRVLFDSDEIPLVQDWRFGDGKTDGIGIIGIMLDSGGIYTSNSQSGGASYPEKTHLNHEMLGISAFAATDCYTTGTRPNTVSMDYIFLEAIEKINPYSGELHLETWDMPLPIPEGKATLTSNNTVELTIKNNANFLPGGTSVDIDFKIGKIVEVTLNSERQATIHIELLDNNKSLKGETVSIESKNLFYYHSLSLKIE